MGKRTDEARRVVDELYAAQLTAEDEALDLLGLLDEAQGRAAAEALDDRLGEDVGRTERRRLEEARGRLAELSASIDEARRRRRQAVRDLADAEADELRAQAAEKRREADARQPRTDELLRALEAHEGIPYEPRRDDRTQGGHYEEPVGAVRVYRPLTERLRREADGLDAEARKAAARRARDRGSIADADGAAELVAAVRDEGPFVIGPTAPEVHAWAAEVAEGVRPRLDRLPVEHRAAAVLRYDLAWQDGRIDPGRSRVRIVEGAAVS